MAQISLAGKLSIWLMQPSTTPHVPRAERKNAIRCKVAGLAQRLPQASAIPTRRMAGAYRS